MTKTEKTGCSPLPLEIWGGIECTLNRVGEIYYDQLVWNGHDTRPQDLSLFADLGLQAIRYPVLWERTAPDGTQNINWKWTDERLGLLQTLNIRPIVGLVHHGSGPHYTNLLDPAFPQKLAEYARKVAERYPWVTEYTPINEPLTTARFSGLYGHWYPHLADARSFIRILINEIRGIQQAMRAIHEINPAAQLIQTEDIGKVYSPPVLDYQAQHENERRWLTFDLLCGRVDPRHPLFGYLTWLGITQQELEAIQQDAMPPHILGIDYYVTSERYLDDRIGLFPSWVHGGNGRHTYVDLDAIRVCVNEPAGYAGILQEAWDRYHLPLALTEVHLGGHREQQLRWWFNAFHTVNVLRQTDIDIRAITAWSLLGNFNWNNLVTQDTGFYETGVFDVHGSHPRPTLLARAIKVISKDGYFDHPILNGPGWWQIPERLLHPPVRHADLASSGAAPSSYIAKQIPRPILIVGVNESLNQAFQSICNTRKIPCLAPSFDQLDLTDEKRIAQMLTEMHPWAMIDTTDLFSDRTEHERETSLRAKTGRSTILIQLCALHKIALLSFSSDRIFNETYPSIYSQDDNSGTLGSDSAMKTEEDAGIREINQQVLIIQVGHFFDSRDSTNFTTHVSDSVSARPEFTVTTDIMVSETSISELVHASLDLLMDGEKGIWYLAKNGSVLGKMQPHAS